MQSQVNYPRERDKIDIQQSLEAVRRSILLVISLPILVGIFSYWLSSREKPIYVSTSSIIAIDNNAQNTLINNTLVTAPPLPQGAVEKITKSKYFMDHVISYLKSSSLKKDTLESITNDLENKGEGRKLHRFVVKERLDSQERGVYEITSQGETPQAAAILAEAGSDAIISWDNNRSKQGVIRSRKSLELQVKNLDQRIQSLSQNSLERQSLISARGQVLQNLSQISVLETAASGTLVPVSEASVPLAPISPRPLSNAITAFLITLFLTVVFTLLRNVVSNKVNTAEDILPFGIPLLGQLPLIKRKDNSKDFIDSVREGAFYESIGFLRINILSLLRDGKQGRFAISSSYPGEGKSSVTAALAESLSFTGLKVLIIDADLRRPNQMKIWSSRQLEFLPMEGTDITLPPAKTLEDMLLSPKAAYVTHVSDKVDIIPAQAGHKDAITSSILGNASFGEHIGRWSEGYDIVLIDTPPMLSLPDTLAISPYTDGIIFIAESGKVTSRDLSKTLQNATSANANIIGLVLNKVKASFNDYYYTYGSRA